MISARSANLLSSRVNVVGTVHSAAGLRTAISLPPGAVDLLEIRLDCFAKQRALLKQVHEGLPALKFPLILTARHPAEGGACAMTASKRIELLEKFLPHAAFIDIEVRSLAALDSIFRRARAEGVGVIVSHHSFNSTPALPRLRELALRAVKAQADILKIAAFTETPLQLSRLLEFAATERRIRLSMMGMGPLGKMSRLLFSQAGSVLNYGFLDKSQVWGQWPAAQLKERVQELSGG